MVEASCMFQSLKEVIAKFNGVESWGGGRRFFFEVNAAPRLYLKTPICAHALQTLQLQVCWTGLTIRQAQARKLNVSPPRSLAGDMHLSV